MKKLWTWTLALLLIASLSVSALTEGLTVEEEEWVEAASVAAAEAVEDNEAQAEAVSGDVERVVPETEEDLPAVDEIRFEDETAVSASQSVAIDETSFPDETFRDYVRTNFDKNGDGTLSEKECGAVKSIQVQWNSITSVKGIEWFPNLKELECYNNQLTSLNVSKNTALVLLRCRSNQLTDLDVSKNTALTELWCDCNKLTSLDVSKNTALTQMICGCTQLKSLDLSKNTALIKLDCSNTQLKSLDLSKNTALKELECTNNHRLMNLDVSGHKVLTSLTCYGNSLTKLNMRGCMALAYLTCSGNQLTSLDLSTNTALKELYIGESPLTELDVSKNTALTALQCESTQLKSLDLSGNTAIERLFVRNNNLTSLKVEGCTHLNSLYCYGNQLTSLDVSGCTNLSELCCYMNPLTSLDVSNCGGLINAAKTAPYEPYGPEEEVIGFHWAEGMVDDYTIETIPTISITANGKVLYWKGVPTPEPESIKKAKVTVKNATYTGEKLEPDVTVKLAGKTLQFPDYIVIYSKNIDVGVGKVIITGIGKYTDTVTTSFKINPKQVLGLKLTAGRKKLTTSWKKVSGVTGYELQYDLKQNFKSAKTVTVKKASTVKKTINQLKAKKTYYVRIRAYKTVKGKKYYSSWSKAVKMKTK